MMKNLFLSNGGWLLRVSTVSVLVLTVGLSLLPRFVSHVSTSAVVNAPLVIIRSPIEGTVEESSVRNGIPIRAGQTLVSFRETDTDLTLRADLEAQLRVAKAAAEAVAARIVEVEAVQQRLINRQSVYLTWHTAILEREVKQYEAQLRAAVARMIATDEETERKSVLHGRGMISDSAWSETRAQQIEQTERVRELEALLDAHQLKLSAAHTGILAGTDGTNTPYSLQRQDEVALEIARLRDEVRDHEAVQLAIEEQLAKELQIYQQENQVSLSSPVSGIVWRASSLLGRPVLPGDEVVEILNCEARFLEAYLPENLMGSLQIGDRATIRLTGDPHSFTAPVVSILGHGARFDHVELAAQDNEPKTGKMRVLIALGQEELPHDPDRFCHVGRTAQVSLPRELSHVGNLLALFTNSVESMVAWVGGSTGDSERG